METPGEHVPEDRPAILLVDDHEEILEFLRNDLGDRYQIFTARNGSEALNVLAAETVQLVISDIMMPVMDGFELCRLIKNDFENSHIPVILLTAKNTLQSKIEGLEMGADAYIDKPFSPEHVQVQIANLLNNRHKIREFFAKSPLVNMKSMAYSRSDEQFLDKLNNVILANMEDIHLDVEHLARFMNTSRPTLYRKINAISNLTPKELINVARLKKAASLLLEGFPVSVVAETVGYTSPTHFGRNFQKQFSMSPTEYVKGKK